MDTAGAESLETAARPVTVPGTVRPVTVPGTVPQGSPSIGVPSIPPVGARAQPPSAVPSVPLPGWEPASAGARGDGAVDVAGGESPPPVVPIVPDRPVSIPAECFPAGVAERLRAYVYLLVDPRTGRPFYVGRGRGDRCFRHVREARCADRGQEPEFPVLDRIRQAESTGREVRIDILRHGMKGSEAALVERATRDVLGLAPDQDDPGRRTVATELGARLAKRAKFKRSHQVVLLRVGPNGSDPSYDAARHQWRIGRRWVDLDSPRSPRWAAVVAGDLVVNVYRIEGWEPSPGRPAATSAGRVDRYSFVGSVDDELERRYRDRSVAPYFGAGAPAQVTYVWCGPHWVNAPH